MNAFKIEVPQYELLLLIALANRKINGTVISHASSKASFPESIEKKIPPISCHLPML